MAIAGPSMAQFRVEVSGLGAAQLPIALPQFRGEAAAPHKVSAIVKADLERSGLFRSIDAAGINVDETTALNASLWRQRGADFAVAGTVLALAMPKAPARLSQRRRCIPAPERSWGIL